MNSEIHIKKPPLKVYITIGLFATAVPVLIVSMILMPDVWRVVLYVGAGLLGLRSVVWIAKQSGEISHRNRLHEIEERRARYMPVPASHNLFDVISGAAVDLPDRRRLAAGPIVEGEAIERRRSVLDLLRDGTHFFIFGNDGSGKTTLANHIIDALCIGAAVAYALDPHGKFNHWSRRATVVDSYEAIRETLHRLFLEMTRRYEAGPGDYPPLIIAIDEWPAVVDECPEVAEYLKRISREGRKVQVRMIVLSQSGLVEDIGSNSSVRNNFVRIALDRETTRQNLATIRHWDRSTELIDLAGTYGVQGRWFGGQPAVLSLPEPEDSKANRMAEFVELVRDGTSRNEASVQVFGKPYAGSSHVQRCKIALGEG